MTFEDIEQKKRFVETLMNEGLQAAKEQYLKEKSSQIFREGQTRNILGENLTLEQAEAKYPNVKFILIKRRIIEKPQDV